MANKQILLVGNPNGGKTTLFNALTGSCQKIGNWPGVTVERKSGEFCHDTLSVDVVDLPGTYSLIVPDQDDAVDIQIACQAIFSTKADVIVNVVDACHLERHLYLTAQLLELGVPMIVALTMMDVAARRGIQIDTAELSQKLGCQVLPLVAHKGEGIEALKAAIIKPTAKPATNLLPTLPKKFSETVSTMATKIAAAQPQLEAESHQLAARVLERDQFAYSMIGSELTQQFEKDRQLLEAALGEETDILMADNRYQWVHDTVAAVSHKPTRAMKSRLTTVLDNIVLNRFLGIPIFLLVMYAMFFFAINIGGAFQDFFDISTDTIFVQGLAYGLHQLHCPAWLVALLAGGLGRGLNTVITFVPVLGAMYLFLAFLEDSGYMARAAFVMDRLMRALGLPGKAFVPMIVGFGCNVPAIMGARTLESRRDRILTIMMSPFMSCGARLTIFAVFTAAFFPTGGQNIVFLLYLAGIAMAVLTGFVVRKTLLKGEPTPFVMELPNYHWPAWSAMFRHSWQRLQGFLWRAGKLIVPVCMLIGLLNMLTIHGTVDLTGTRTDTLLASVGRLVTPLFAPMGLHADNWPATVGLITGVLAKEVVIATLNGLYSQIGHLATTMTHFSLLGGLQEAVASVPANLAGLKHAFSNPLMATVTDTQVNQGVFGQMAMRFDGKIGAFAYLLFILLYFPCISATAAIARELDKRWALFSVFWSTAMAYATATIFYQLATFSQHQKGTLAWLIVMLALFSTTVVLMIRYQGGSQHASEH